jgi:hypothetical protein
MIDKPGFFLRFLTSSQIYNAQILIKNLTYREKKMLWSQELGVKS